MSKVMTWAKLRQMIALGMGQGHGEAYRPFIEVRRKSASPKGNQSVGPLPGTTRPYHALTRVERQIGVLCCWLGALDVREQFPAWPFEHPHPLAGAVGASSFSKIIAPGLLTLAEEAGIAHGVSLGSDVPYVATLDVVVTLAGQVAPRIVVFSCKGRAELESASSTSRMMQRLELERRYCAAISATYHIAHELALSPTLLSNLEDCGASVQAEQLIRAAAEFPRFASLLKGAIAHTSIRAAVEYATARSGIQRPLAWPAFKLLAWRLVLDVDLSAPTQTSRVAELGGRELRAALRRWLFKEAGNA
ncbi:hypothetical protein P3T32_003703 [Ralstonia sp. GP73]|uniref:Transposase n=1 Tax=Ralstonia thomasii TaxID=3058596 RepID=A0ABM9JLK2_9RALS|nr:hypothetical protein [Ralstonia sp. GP73]CAJ0797647.1 hypothetical protein LMG18095_03069 [Ralstonia sp. LMG 18095]